MDEMTPFDLERMLLGEIPMAVLFEIVVRTVVMYLYTVGLVRLLGKRGVGQLAPFELVIIIALGSAVGDPMLHPDVGLLQGFFVITCIVLLQRALTVATARSDGLERLIESEPARVVKDGRVETAQIAKERMHPDELFEALREQGVENLGAVREAFLEPSGRVSVFAFGPGDERWGLPLTPARGTGAPAPDLEHGDPVREAGYYACLACGNAVLLRQGTAAEGCGVCRDRGHWVRAELPATARNATQARTGTRHRALAR
jgi:uncharacterized membrane protein YcaP (DUF421 family)